MFTVNNFVNVMYVNCYMAEIKNYSIFKHFEVPGHLGAQKKSLVEKMMVQRKSVCFEKHGRKACCSFF